MSSLNDRVAVITGGTCGVGRGVARALAREGARVYITGRSVPDGATGDGLTGIRCDHREETDVVTAFARVTQEAGGIDILVNNVWGGYERMIDNGVFTWSKPFWEQPVWRWDAMFSAGVRAHYRASQGGRRSGRRSQGHGPYGNRAGRRKPRARIRLHRYRRKGPASAHARRCLSEYR